MLWLEKNHICHNLPSIEKVKGNSKENETIGQIRGNAMSDIHHELLVETIQFLDEKHFRDIQRHDNPAGSLRYKIDRVLNHNEVDLKRINEKLTNYIDVERRLKQRGHI